MLKLIAKFYTLQSVTLLFWGIRAWVIDTCDKVVLFFTSIEQLHKA